MPGVRTTVVFVVTLCAPVLGCGGSHPAPSGNPISVSHPEASCPVTIASYPLQAALHVDVGTDIQWNSNPPSSGEHYPVWAAYRDYGLLVPPKTVPRGYYVHDLEHGAIVLLYQCPTGDCGGGGIAGQLQAVADSLPADPLCVQLNNGVRVRTVITPDPLINSPVAAAAWGWTYTADCVDAPTLRQFALAHYGQGPEALCGDGTTDFPLPDGGTSTP
jgi:hypothetical protein